MSPAAGRKMWTLVVTIQGREEKRLVLRDRTT